MFKKSVFITCFFSSLLYCQDIPLSGDSIQRYTNPYRVIFEDKNKPLHIFSEDKLVSFSVSSNSSNNLLNSSFSLHNKDLENVLKSIFESEYNIIPNSKGGLELNIIKASVFLDYADSNDLLVKNVSVDITFSITKNGSTFTKQIVLDKSLGEDNRSYKGFITNEDFQNLSSNSTVDLISKILEKEIFNVVKDVL